MRGCQVQEYFLAHSPEEQIRPGCANRSRSRQQVGRLGANKGRSVSRGVGGGGRDTCSCIIYSSELGGGGGGGSKI